MYLGPFTALTEVNTEKAVPEALESLELIARLRRVHGQTARSRSQSDKDVSDIAKIDTEQSPI
jgi:hypothetical protein